MTRLKKRLKILERKLSKHGYDLSISANDKHSAHLKCNKSAIKGYRLFDIIYLDRVEEYDKISNCPVAFNLNKVNCLAEFTSFVHQLNRLKCKQVK